MEPKNRAKKKYDFALDNNSQKLQMSAGFFSVSLGSANEQLFANKFTI